MALGGDTAAGRVERFLSAHPVGPLVVCVGSASVAGIVWLSEHARGRPVTLLIGDMKSRNFAMATGANRQAALDFVSRSDVSVRNWYRTGRSSDGRAEAHLKVWAACDDAGAPQAFLVGSANLTIAGLHDNVEVMAFADPSEHAYLRSAVQQLLDKSWDAEERLRDWIEHGDNSGDQRRHRPQDRKSGCTSPRTGTTSSRRHDAPAASTGCGPRALAMATLVATGVAYLMERCRSRF